TCALPISPRNAYLPSPAPAGAQRVVRNTGPRCRTCFRRAGVTHRRAAGRSTDTGITCAAPSGDTRQLAPQGFALGRLSVGAGAVGDTGTVLTAISIGLLIDEGRTVDTKCAIRHSHSAIPWQARCCGGGHSSHRDRQLTSAISGQLAFRR